MLYIFLKARMILYYWSKFEVNKIFIKITISIYSNKNKTLIYFVPYCTLW
jgi:hypothetical protein